MHRLTCRTTGRVLVPRLTVATPLSWRGARGLIGRTVIADDEALLLHDALGCIHTFGMRVPIDIVFCDAALTVVEVAGAVPPRRVRWRYGAPVQIEVRAGRAAELGLVAGVALTVRSAHEPHTGGQEFAESPHPTSGSGMTSHNPAAAPCATARPVPTFRALSPAADGPLGTHSRR